MSAVVSTVPTPEHKTEWREVPSLPGYRVSSDGQVQKSKAWRKRAKRQPAWLPIKPQRLPSGYFYIHTHHQAGDGRRVRHIRYVHQLVAEAFHGPCPEGQEVRHDNGNRADNRAANLLYGTRLDNAADQLRHGTRPRGSRHGIAKLTEEDVLKIRTLLAAGLTQAAIAPEFGVSPSSICHINRGKTWAHIMPPGDC